MFYLCFKPDNRRILNNITHYINNDTYYIMMMIYDKIYHYLVHWRLSNSKVIQSSIICSFGSTLRPVLRPNYCHFSLARISYFDLKFRTFETRHPDRLPRCNIYARKPIHTCAIYIYIYIGSTYWFCILVLRRGM